MRKLVHFIGVQPIRYGKGLEIMCFFLKTNDTINTRHPQLFQIVFIDGMDLIGLSWTLAK
jgi:hypothetical protein